MIDTSFLCMKFLSPNEVLDVVVKILNSDKGSVYLFDKNTEDFIGNEDASIKCVYELVRGSFSFSLDLYFSEGSVLQKTEAEICRLFSEETGVSCAIDTPDANPYTWLLMGKGLPDRIISIDDQYNIV